MGESFSSKESLGSSELVVCRLQSASMLQIPVHICGKSILAIVDTAAEVTIISDQVFETLGNKPKISKKVIMHAAGRDMQMNGVRLEPIEMGIGKKTYSESMYVAPIEDDMLLGLDFLLKHQANVNLGSQSLEIGNEKLSLRVGKNNSVRVKRITVNKKIVVPAFSVLRIPCKMDSELQSDYIVEPFLERLFAPKTLQKALSKPIMVFVNCNDRNIKLAKNQTVGFAYEIDGVLSPDNDIDTYHVAQANVQEINDRELKVPDHLYDLYRKSAENLKPDQTLALRQLLCDYADVFARSEFDLGNFTAITHSIDTGDAKPIKERIRRTPQCFVEEEEKHLNKMLAAGIIEPSVSEWASAPVLIRKKDKSLRWCIDYRKLNAVSKKDVFPLPIIDECIDSLIGNIWFSKLDANSAYFQVRVNEADKSKTAFITKYGTYQFVKMPFGLCNAPSTFSRVMNLVLRGLTWNVVLAFLDDILVLGDTFQSHIQNLREVFDRFRSFGLKLKPKKCELFQTEVEFLGRVVSQNGIEIGPGYVETINSWPVPKTTKDVEKFCGFANYHRNFIQDLAQLAIPLYAVTGKRKFYWGEQQQSAFENIKRALTSKPVLTLPTLNDQFILDTDASDQAIGAVLSQIQNGQERAIGYASIALTPEQKRYCTTRKELLAVVKFTRQFKHYLLGREFIVRSDHSSLQWIMNFKNPNHQLARWLEELSQYVFTIQYRAGKYHENADALSRLPSGACSHYKSQIELSDLPCGGCKYCERAHKNWSQFNEEVDDVLPLYNLSGRQVCKTESYDCFEPSIFETGLGSVSDDSSRDVLHDCGCSKKDFISSQEADPELSIILDWCKNNVQPSEYVLSLSSPTSKTYWLNKELFVLDSDGMLWKKDKNDPDKSLLVIPSSVKTEIMRLSHSVPSAGHQSVDRTLGRIKSRFYWNGRNRDVKSFILSCSVCNKNKKPNRQARGSLTLFHSGFPLERVHLDFLGPLTETKNNNKYILMIVDQFSKWVECIALPSQTAELTAKAAVDNFFSRFGYPFQIHTDQGTNFESSLFKSLCERMGIHKTRTTAFRPSSNGQVERFNRTLVDALRCFVSRTPAEWDEFLPQIAWALRSVVNRSTGFTPNMLMLGREVVQPLDVIFPSKLFMEPTDPETYVAKLVENTKIASEIARGNLKANQEVMKKNYDLKVNVSKYKVGDAVYVLDTAQVKGKCRKLSPTWKGPGLVVEILTSLLYKVKLRGEIKTMNHDRLKICQDTNLPLWIQRHQREFEESGQLSDVSDQNKYCICGGTDRGTFMIQCDECREWFHGSCVNVTPVMAKDIGIYECPQCIN